MAFEKFLSSNEDIISKYNDAVVTNNRVISYHGGLIESKYKDIQLDKISSITHESQFSVGLLAVGLISLTLGLVSSIFGHYSEAQSLMPASMNIVVLLISALSFGYAILNRKDLCRIKTSDNSIALEGKNNELYEFCNKINAAKNNIS